QRPVAEVAVGENRRVAGEALADRVGEVGLGDPGAGRARRGLRVPAPAQVGRGGDQLLPALLPHGRVARALGEQLAAAGEQRRQGRVQLTRQVDVDRLQAGEVRRPAAGDQVAEADVGDLGVDRGDAVDGRLLRFDLAQNAEEVA